MHPLKRLRFELGPFPPLPLPRICRRIFGFTFLFAVFLSTPRAAEPVPPAAPPILVGGSTDNYPYSFLDERGQLAGFSVDVFAATARAIGLKVQRVLAPSARINQLFQDGKITVHPYFSQRTEHLGYADFSVPYLTLQGALFVRSGDQRFPSFEDLRLKHARVVTGPAGRDYALAHGLDAAQLIVTVSEDALRQLDEGRADVALFARLSASAVIYRFGLRHIETQSISLDDYVLRNGFAVNPGQAPLLARLNEGLAIIYRNGEFEAIYQKWFGRFEPARFSREEIIRYVAAALALALAGTAWALLHQRQLRRRIARQAEELAEHQTILAEAQRFALIGHWQRRLGRDEATLWSDETYRIYERDPSLGPPRFDELIAYGIPEDRARWADTLQEATLHHTSFDLEICIEPRTGLRKNLHLRGRPARDAAGRPVGLFGTVQDITSWRQAQHALLQSEQLLRALYDTLPHALGVAELTDREWRLVSINPGAAQILGFASNPLPGTTLADLKLTPERQIFWNDLFTRCVTTGTTLFIERTEPQRQCDYAITVVPLAPTARSPRCCFFIEDITARKRRDSEISRGRRLRAIGKLVGGIAHEFNNLLTPILLKSDQLERHPDLPPAFRGELNVITATTRRAAELTRRLLTFGRIHDHSAEAVDLPALITSNLDLVRQTSDRRIVIALLPLPPLPILHLNSGDSHQILLNLLINARDTLVEKLARPAPADWHALVEVGAALLPASAATAQQPAATGGPDHWVRLTVRDNGMGMPPAVLERIFEPFYTTKPVGAGTGLGLATVWHLVSDLGGRIEVESTVGAGTTFHVDLPVWAPPASIPPPPAAILAAPAPRPFAPRHLLVAEDEPMISKIVMTVLNRAGHTVELAADGLTAWHLLAAAPEKFDAVLMDLNMPGYSGLELARRARALPYARPLLVMSGRVSDEDRLEFTGLKISAILQKPFTPEELLSTFVAAGITHAPPAGPNQL